MPQNGTVLRVLSFEDDVTGRWALIGLQSDGVKDGFVFAAVIEPAVDVPDGRARPCARCQDAARGAPCGVIYIATNLVPILAATVVGLVVGLLYAALAGRLAARGGPRFGLLAVAALAEFWLAAILAGALILAPVQVNPWVVAIGSAVIIWIGFVLPALVVNHLYRDLPLSALAGDTAHWLVVMVAQAAVLHAVGLVRP